MSIYSTGGLTPGLRSSFESMVTYQYVQYDGVQTQSYMPPITSVYHINNSVNDYLAPHYYINKSVSDYLAPQGGPAGTTAPVAAAQMMTSASISEPTSASISEPKATPPLIKKISSWDTYKGPVQDSTVDVLVDLGCHLGMASLGIPAWRIFLAGPVLRMAYSLATLPSSRKERVVTFALDMFGPNIAKKALNKWGLPYYLVRFGVPFVWNLWRHRGPGETIKCIALDTFISVVFDSWRTRSS